MPVASAGGGWAPRLAWALALVVGGAACALLLAVPEIDLLAARGFYSREFGFVGLRLGWVEAVRYAFAVLFVGTIALCFLGLALIWRGRLQWLGLGRLQWVFLAACLAAGPGLVANLVLKDQWGRARPKQVVEFGGTKAYTPPLLIADQCRRNCSFVSGEASSTYVVFYAAAAIAPQWSVALVLAGTVGGLAAGLIRMSQGAHFLSDVVFAGVFMALTVLLLRRLMLPSPGPAKQGNRPPGEMSADDALAAAWRDLEQFAFGDSPEMADELLALVLAGTKTATASALRAYEVEGEPIPRVGERGVVLDGRGRPACVIETCEVALRRFDEVDEAFARDEGEGDCSLACWRREHERFFRRQGPFAGDMQLVCERFRLIAILPRQGEAP